MDTTYSETGQAGQVVTRQDGTYDQPARVLVSCDTCGAIVPATRTARHSASHSTAESSSVL